MANPKYLKILSKGVRAWNAWREHHADEQPDLTKAKLHRLDLFGINFADTILVKTKLNGANLFRANLERANLCEATLIEADLRETDFERANLTRANLSKAGLSRANFRDVDLTEVDLTQAVLYEGKFPGAILTRATLSKAILNRADLSNADLREADLRDAECVKVFAYEADMRGANFRNNTSLYQVDFGQADLRKADLRGASLVDSNLWQANLVNVKFGNTNLKGTDLREANLSGTNLRKTNLSETDLSRANLRKTKVEHCNMTCSVLVETHLEEASLANCNIYGAAVWKVGLQDTSQNNLIITPDNEPKITVDNLEVAQFVYLLLNNKKIRGVIDTIGEKGVLILGRFTKERKAVLDAIRNKLRDLGFVPMMFDFEKPTQRDFTETIKTLAGLSRFIIADITNPKSSPLELQATMPDYMIPFVPIIHESEEPFAMFRDLKQKYGEWVLDVLQYDSAESLVAVLDKAVVRPALKMSDELLLKKAETIRTRHVKDYGENFE